MFRLLVVLAVLQPLFGGRDPIKGGPWYHEEMTRDAADAAGWDVGEPDDHGTAGAALAWHADYVDSYLYNPLWWAAGGLRRFRAALLHRDQLAALHFDDLTSIQQVHLVWRRYRGGTVAGLLWAAEHDDVDAARNVVGAGVHALQDFYSHSNWVDDPARRSTTWADAESTEDLHVYTGAYETPHQGAHRAHGKIMLECILIRRLPADLMNAMFGSHSPLQHTSIGLRWRECRDAVATNHPTIGGVDMPDGVLTIDPPGIALDSPWLAKVNIAQRDLPDRGEVTPDELFLTARTLAGRHTRDWLQELASIMVDAGHEAFWSRVMTQRRTGEWRAPGADIALESLLSGYDGDLQQFEDRWRAPFAFVSAGAYPPAPGGTDEGWFLRLEIRTADEADAGTDADISAEIDGVSFVLDHMRRRTHHGGLAEVRILEHDDFERGGHDTYIVGPLPAQPGKLVLRNTSASAWDVVAGAWSDLVRSVSDTIDDLRTALLGIIAGNADLVGGDQMSWSWLELEGLARGGGSEFVLRVRGGGEGDYDLFGRVEAQTAGTGLRVTVTTHRMHCIREASGILSDRFSTADEPFVLMLVTSPAAATAVPWRSDPFDDVDSDEYRDLSHVGTVDVPRYGGLVVATQVWESDDESGGDRDRLRDDFARGYSARTVNARSVFLDALGRAIAPDWRIGSLDAYAFSRAATVEVEHLVTERKLDRWIGAGETLEVPFDDVPTTSVALASGPADVGAAAAAATGH